MNTLKNISYSILIFTLALFASGCSNNNDSATIKGSVEGEQVQQKVQSGSLEGAMITAAQVTSNGSLQTMDGVQAETNASGNFTLNIDVKSAQHIVIIAEKEGKRWAGYLSGHVKNGSTYTLKPLNTESSAETEIFTRLVASGHADIVSKADVEAVVTNNTAAEIKSSTIAANRVAVALKNAAQARAEYYSETLGSNADAALEATFKAMAEAQFHLESEIAATVSAEQRAEAYDVFVEAIANAYVKAGLSASESAKSVEMWSRVFVNSLTATSSNVRRDARMHASLVAAAAIDLAVRAEAEASGMSSSSREVIIQAGIDLRSSIKTSAGVSDEIKAAFRTYRDEVKSTMENDTSFEASVIIAVDSEINSSSGAKSKFTSSIVATLSASLVVNIYETFFSNIKSTVESHANGSSESEIMVITNMMMLINLAS